MGVLHEVYVSNNGMYLLGKFSEENKLGEFALYDMSTEDLIAEFKSPYEIGGHRAAVSESGRYVATAAYSHKGLSLIDGVTGEEIWNTREVKRIQRVTFSNDESKVIVSNENEPAHTYYIDIATGKVENRIVASEVFPNAYGDEIVFWHRDVMLLGGKKIKSPTFCFLTAYGTPYGVAVSPVVRNLRMYDYDGNFMWSAHTTTDSVDHIVHIGYNAETDRLYACTRGAGIYEICPQSGEIIDYKYILGHALIRNSSAVLDRHGDIHEFSDME